VFLPLLKNPNVASLAGVKHYVVFARDSDGRPHDPPVADLDHVSFSEPPTDPLPRAFLVGQYEVLPAEETLDRMRRREFDPARKAILERAPSGIELPEDGQARGTATVVSRKASEVVVETESKTDSILVLTDSYYPGWMAEVDGERVDILRANYVFRAVPLAAGKHRVIFRFRPLSFTFGAIFSCVGALCWAGWAAAPALRRRA
jgi:hypothetical protein